MDPWDTQRCFLLLEEQSHQAWDQHKGETDPRDFMALLLMIRFRVNS